MKNSKQKSEETITISTWALSLQADPLLSELGTVYLLIAAEIFIQAFYVSAVQILEYKSLKHYCYP